MATSPRSEQPHRRLLPFHREIRYPNLGSTDYYVTSDPTDEYNCAAFALGITNANWWPEPNLPEYHWPPAAKRDDSLQAFIEGFGQFRFEPCENGEREPGFEKIVVFAEDGEPLHVAVQLEDGRWTSKLGLHEDIVHPTPDALTSPGWYGTPCLFLRRPRA